ncbi:MAG: hypothetical protein ACXVFT_00820 [Solirubrobacteraceae bacterium]
MLFAGKRLRRGTAATTSAVLALGACATGAIAQSGSGTGDLAPTPTAPSSGVSPTTVKSGRASLSRTHACTKTSFPLTIAGRSMRRVTVYINGRLVKRITVKSTATRVTTKLPTPVATSKIVVKVTFVSTTGTKPKTFSRTVKRCVPAAVKPNFTG